MTSRKDGKVLNTLRFTVSKYRKTITVWQGGTNNAGLAVSNFTVYDKQ